MGGGDQPPRWTQDPILTHRDRDRRSGRVAAAAALQGRLLADVQAMWRTVVGDAIADEAVPQAERDGIACRSAVWAHEIDLMANVLLQLLNEQIDHPARGAPASDGRRLLRRLVARAVPPRTVPARARQR